MAILWVREAYASEGNESKDGYDFVVGWTVATDSAADEEYQVMNANKIPRLGDPHRSGRAVAIRRRAQRLRGEDSPFTWRVEIEFGKADQLSTSGSGLTRKEDLATIEFSQVNDKWAPDYDFHGIPIRNSAGDRFASIPDIDENCLKITIEAVLKFEALNDDLIALWQDTVHGTKFLQKFVNDPRAELLRMNVPAFFGHMGGTIKMTEFGAKTRHDVDGGRQEKDKSTVWQVSLSFTARRSWLGALLDEGTRQITNGPWNVSPGQLAGANLDTIKPILDANGVPLIRPVFLNGRGGRLVRGNPFWLVYQKHPHGDLNELMKYLGLPTNIAGYKIKGGPAGAVAPIVIPGAGNVGGGGPGGGLNQPPGPAQGFGKPA